MVVVELLWLIVVAGMVCCHCVLRSGPIQLGSSIGGAVPPDTTLASSTRTWANAEGDARAWTGLGWKIGSTGAMYSGSGGGGGDWGACDFSCARFAFIASFDVFPAPGDLIGGDLGEGAPLLNWRGTTSSFGMTFDRLGSVRL